MYSAVLLCSSFGSCGDLVGALGMLPTVLAPTMPALLSCAKILYVITKALALLQAWRLVCLATGNAVRSDVEERIAEEPLA